MLPKLPSQIYYNDQNVSTQHDGQLQWGPAAGLQHVGPCDKRFYSGVARVWGDALSQHKVGSPEVTGTKAPLWGTRGRFSPSK